MITSLVVLAVISPLLVTLYLERRTRAVLREAERQARDHERLDYWHTVLRHQYAERERLLQDNDDKQADINRFFAQELWSKEHDSEGISPLSAPAQGQVCIGIGDDGEMLFAERSEDT